MFARSIILSAAALLATSCAHRGPSPGDESWYEEVAPHHHLSGYDAAFILSWQGARIGSAVEKLRPRRPAARDQSAGFEFTRHEDIVIRRGGALVPYTTTITITTDASLRADEISIRRQAGATTTTGTGTRNPAGDWVVSFGDEPARMLDGAAVPAELVPLLVASTPERHFSGAVIMAGYGFSVAHFEVDPEPGSNTPAAVVTATVTTALGELESTIELTADGTIARAHGGDAVSARRVVHAELEVGFDPPELVDSASIEVSGHHPRHGSVTLLMEVDREAPPPALPGQRVALANDHHWRIELLPGDQGDSLIPVAAAAAVTPEVEALANRVVRAAGANSQRSEIAALARATEQLLDDDLAAPAVEASAALALGRGDCTAHATLFAALAQSRGISTRLVTGYRLDGRRLVRHRWALAAVDGHWMAVDPAHAEAPTRPRLLGLAIHGTSAAEIAVVDDLAFAGMRSATARFVD